MSFRAFSIFCIAIFSLFACTSSPTRQAKQNDVKTSKKITEVLKNSDYYLTQAKQNYATNNDIYQRNSYLIKAGEALQAEQQCEKSISLLNVLQPELQDNRQRTHVNLIIAECYLLLSDDAFDNVAVILNKISHPYGYQTRIASLETQLQVHKKQWLRAAKALQNTNIAELKKAQKIWQWLKKLDLAELEKARLAESTLQPWLQLAIIVQNIALKPELFRQQLVNWQRRHIGHPLATHLPEEIQQSLLQLPIQATRIAVLLPLTGRLANQGLAIKEGILAAYIQHAAQRQNPTQSAASTGKSSLHNIQQYQEIRFFDSALKTAKQLNALVTDFDVVLGPLVKQKITELAEILATDKILLALNRVPLATDTPTLDQLASPAESNLAVAEHYYFSLAPEDEAQQLALHIHEKQLIRPIVFAANNPTTQRMAAAFIAKWQDTSKATSPDLIIFTDNKDMRIRVSEMLDVAQSKKRIEQIGSLSDVEVFGVARNRRDIDAIVLFANPEQTQLLNPIIEASLSPFARKSLSVFASSRSYSVDLNSNSLRDLRNLTFTDMPWMLPDHSWQALASQSQLLWPQRQDSLLRLFAMGYDAYNLLPNLRQLKTLPHLVSHGLTGSINVDQQGVLHRRLPWAQVTRQGVQSLAMD